MDYFGKLVVLYTEAAERWTVGLKVLEKFSLTAYHYTNARWPTLTSPKRLSLETVNTTNVPVNRTAGIQERTFDGGDITARSTERLYL